MADVSGKGIAAALLMSNFQANLHAFVKHDTNLLDLMEQLNTNVFDSAKGEKFITVFIARINLRTREIFYINAGHNPPFLHSPSQTVLLEEGTTGLGMFEELPFLRYGSAPLPDNALLLCYTDGVVDLENESNQYYGMDKLKHYLQKNAMLPSIADFHKHLVDDLIRYKQNNPFNDDVTLLSVRFK
jgi:sigma-B regulation protein RsbU (phosphoserine phosphatase)